MFMHCRLCMQTKPSNKSMAEWAQLEVSLTHTGIMVWCRRHNRMVVHLTPGQLHEMLVNEPECEMCKKGIPH